MEKILNFVDCNEENLEAIGPGHQVLGISHKGKYMLGNTYINKYSGKVNESMYYAVKIAKLD